MSTHKICFYAEITFYENSTNMELCVVLRASDKVLTPTPPHPTPSISPHTLIVGNDYTFKKVTLTEKFSVLLLLVIFDFPVTCNQLLIIG